MCFLYPCGIPLLFALLMRRERQSKLVKASTFRVCWIEHWLTGTAALQGEDFLDSYIGFVAAGYSLKVRRHIMGLLLYAHENSLTASSVFAGHVLGASRDVPQARNGCHQCAALGALWQLEHVLTLTWRAGVFAVDGAFNAAVTPDVSGALAPVVQPFLGQLVTGVCAAALARSCADVLVACRALSFVPCTPTLVPPVREACAQHCAGGA